MTVSVEVDPVCGMEVDPVNAAAHSEYEDKVYYFCTEECKRKFDSAPADFADES